MRFSVMFLGGALAFLVLFGNASRPVRNKIVGNVVADDGMTPLQGVMVSVLDMNNTSLNEFVVTDFTGSFSLRVPEKIQAFQLLFHETKDEYWKKRQAVQNNTHPHALGTITIYSVSRRLTAIEVREQVVISEVLMNFNSEESKQLIGRLGTEYASLLRPPSCESLATMDTRSDVKNVSQAIALPNLLRSRIAANEASAVGTMRTINTAEVTYASIYPDVGFADSLQKLGSPPPDQSPSEQYAGLIDSFANSGAKSGYAFNLSTPKSSHVSIEMASFSDQGTSGGPNTSYRLAACPVVPGSTGSRWYFSDESGVIRVSEQPDRKTAKPLQ